MRSPEKKLYAQYWSADVHLNWRRKTQSDLPYAMNWIRIESIPAVIFPDDARQI